MVYKQQITTEPKLDIKRHLSEAKRLIDEALKLLANLDKAGSKVVSKASPPKAKKAKKIEKTE